VFIARNFLQDLKTSFCVILRDAKFSHIFSGKEIETEVLVEWCCLFDEYRSSSLSLVVHLTPSSSSALAVQFRGEEKWLMVLLTRDVKLFFANSSLALVELRNSRLVDCVIYWLSISR
jgi:hypothetical protein